METIAVMQFVEVNSGLPLLVLGSKCVDWVSLRLFVFGLH